MQWRTFRTVGKSPCSLQSQSAFTPKTPINVSSRRQYTADLLAKSLFQSGSPWHQLETEPIVDHRKATRTQRETLAVDTGDMFALDRRTVGKSGLSGELRRGGGQIPLPQRIQQISGEDDPLSLPPSEPFFGKMFEATVHRLPNLHAKSASAQGRFLCKKLAVDPSRPWCCDLRLDRQIGSRRKRRTPSTLAILVSAHFDDRARFGVAGHLKVGKNKVVRAPVDPVNNSIGRASQFVMEPPSYKSTLHRRSGFVAMQGDPCQIGLAPGIRDRAMHGFDDVTAD